MKDAGSLLLLEFITPDGWVYASRHFPFIVGMAGIPGMRCSWVTYGTNLAVVRGEEGSLSHVATLTPADLEDLKGHLERTRPTHIVTSHDVDLPIAALLRQAAPKKLLVAPTELAHRPEEACELFLGQPLHLVPEYRRALRIATAMNRLGWVARFLDFDPPLDAERGNLFLSEAAEFRLDTVRPGNKAALAYRPPLTILGGTTCDYVADMADNPFLADLEFGQCDSQYGCAFCSGGVDISGSLENHPLVAAMRQIQELTHPRYATRLFGILDLTDVRLFDHLPELVARMVDLSVPPCTLRFEVRADRVLKNLLAIQKVLPMMAKEGYKLYLKRMGAESLSAAENERLNKGLTLEQLDQTMQVASHLANQYPGAFDFDRTWAYITCTPWTKLEEYEEAVKAAMQRSFDPLGVWLYTPLLLRPGTAATQRARRDQLITADWEDSAPLYEPWVNQGLKDCGQPWRFRDDRMKPVFGLTVRFCAAALVGRQSDDVFADDRWYRQLQTAGGAQEFFVRPDLFSMAVIRAVQALGASRDWSELMDHALASYRKELASQLPTSAAAAGAETPGRVQRLKYLLEAVIQRFPAKFSLFTVESVNPLVLPNSGESSAAPSGSTGKAGFRIELGIEEQTCLFDVLPLQDGQRSFVRAIHFAVSHPQELPPEARRHSERLRQLFLILDRAVGQYAPELMRP